MEDFNCDNEATKKPYSKPRWRFVNCSSANVFFNSNYFTPFKPYVEEYLYFVDTVFLLLNHI